MRHKQGFTLITWAILLLALAVFLWIMYPYIANSFVGAMAAADAVTLHRAANTLNTVLVINPDALVSTIQSSLHPESELFPGAEFHVLYTDPGIQVFFVKDGQYYGLDYITQVSETGHSDLPTTKPDTNGKWYSAADGDRPER